MHDSSDFLGAMCLPFCGANGLADRAECQDSELASLRLVVHPSGVALPVTRADVIVGRHSQADIRLPMPDVSRRHCRLICSEGKWSIFDLDSLNGIHVNGSRVTRAQLSHRDLIRIGGCLIEVDLRSTTPTVALPAMPGVPRLDPLYSIRDAMVESPRQEAA